MKFTKKIVSAVLIAVMAFTMSACSSSKLKVDTSTELGKAIDSSARFVYKKIGNSPKFGRERRILGLLRSDYMDLWDDRAMNYVENMKTYIQKGGNKIAKGKTIYFDKYPIVFLTHTACGIYADKTGSADLTQGITIDAIVMMGGYDNKINCLTALECAGQGVYPYYNSETQQADLSRESIAEFILGLQNADGSFTYEEMENEGYNAVKVTSDAVVALASTKQTPRIRKAVKAGAEYLKNTVQTTDSLDDMSNAVIALNYADIDASDLVKAIMALQRDDGSFSQVAEDKKGNVDDTATALLAFASQYRFENNLSKLYDLQESYGVAHNKLSPLWTAYVNLMKYRFVVIFSFILFLAIRAKFRIKKWKEQGIYNSETNRQYTDAELAEIRRKKELEETKQLEKVMAANAEAEADEASNTEEI